MLDKDEQWRLRELLTIADKWALVSAGLKAAVDKCLTQGTLKGLDEMVAMSFNAQQFQPKYGGGGGLPPGKYKGVIVDSRQENVEKNGMVTGGYLALDLTPIEGPLTGQKQTDRLNLHNTNPKVVEIANSQLSAYCHVLNKFAFQDSQELHNIPFCFEIGWQKGQEPSEANPNGGYTEVKSIADINGNPPGKAGAGPQAQPQQQPNIPAGAPAGGVQAQGGGWGGAPAQGQPQAQPGIDNGIAMPGQAGGQPQAQPGVAPGGWGAPQGGAQPQQQPAQGGAPAQGGWGQPQGGGQPQGAQGGWAQQPQGGAPAGGGQPAAWGQR